MTKPAFSLLTAAVFAAAIAMPATAMVRVEAPPEPPVPSPEIVWIERWVADFEHQDGSMFGPWNNRNGSNITIGSGGADEVPKGADNLPGFGTAYFHDGAPGINGWTMFDLSGLGAPSSPDQWLKLQFDLAFLDHASSMGGMNHVDFRLGDQMYRLDPMAGVAGAQLIGIGNFVDGSGTDAVFRYEFLLPYVDEFLSFGFQKGASVAGTDFRWGVDNIHVLTSTSPIPEPATWLLLIAGFGMIGFAARKKRRVDVASC